MLDHDLEPIGTLAGDEETGPIRGVAGLSPATLGSGEHDPRGGLRRSTGARGAPRGGRVLEFGPERRRCCGRSARGSWWSRTAWPPARTASGSPTGPPTGSSGSSGSPGGAVRHVGGFGGRGLGPGEFHDPRGIVAMDEGRLVVLDHGNHRGQIFDPDHLTLIAGFGGRLYIEPLKSAATWVPLQPKSDRNRKVKADEDTPSP